MASVFSRMHRAQDLLKPYALTARQSASLNENVLKAIAASIR